MALTCTSLNLGGQDINTVHRLPLCHHGAPSQGSQFKSEPSLEQFASGWAVQKQPWHHLRKITAVLGRYGGCAPRDRFNILRQRHGARQ
ncbi:hypothetical protein E2C01_056480 [Portunus trituberculatus]|uniref:Uncharacterized protein n=1 Tax=Portunus trituberculatus TaxID=210409 RepID=A0A5B7GYA9_PORTR|nr:hypothetical protein [Portunus trituberculatus]